METRINFVEWLANDVSLNIMMRLNDPADVVRAGSVSRLWRQFVVSNGVSKQLCVGRFQQLSRIARITELDLSAAEAKDVGSSNSEWETLKRDHEVYASLLQAIKTSMSCRNDCIGYAVSASSTDNYPDESIVNTLIPVDIYLNRPSYWSSKGHSDPNAPETLIYKLKADLCVITQVCMQPFEAYFQPGKPIYSAKSVRFRLGYPKSSKDDSDILKMPQQQPADDKFIWTYTSEEFPMTQVKCFQRFDLPEPVLCIGGYMQIQLLGRVQRQEMDDLFYICVSHVKVVGRPLSPAFDVEVLEPSQEFVLKYNRDGVRSMLQSLSNGDHQDSNMPPTLSEELVVDAGLVEFFLQNHQPAIEHMDWDDDDDDEMDEVGIF
ncbi:F-box protein At4g00755-like [Lycium barbarum]|uniref:F-box protein At4g00755-like n=1 Tax=Lycium barbarum TaxID=112863 RepID=UPI00293E2C74|nr:F-box protein At4g00755-like [Lycium barbarum]XP_060218780.1 F-box protein At4g00755-like [Lycium barbarum]XP_060218781.1 F-box protein At4g00755-like [Lycium barbarum]